MEMRNVCEWMRKIIIISIWSQSWGRAACEDWLGWNENDLCEIQSGFGKTLRDTMSATEPAVISYE